MVASPWIALDSDTKGRCGVRCQFLNRDLVLHLLDESSRSPTDAWTAMMSEENVAAGVLLDLGERRL